MKSILIILLLMVAIGSKAQKIKSKFLADSIVMPNTFIEIQPIIVTAHGDTARSVYWIMGGFGRDLSPGFTLTTNYYNKQGGFLTYTNSALLANQLPNLVLIKTKIDSLMRVTQPRVLTQ